MTRLEEPKIRNDSSSLHKKSNSFFGRKLRGKMSQGGDQSGEKVEKRLQRGESEKVEMVLLIGLSKAGLGRRPPRLL